MADECRSDTYHSRDQVSPEHQAVLYFAALGHIGGTNLGLSKLDLRSTINKKSIERSPFSFRMHDSVFEGAVSADLSTPKPQARFELRTQDIDIGELLSDLEVAEGVYAHAAVMEIVVNGRGTSLGEIIDSATPVAKAWLISAASIWTGSMPVSSASRAVAEL